MKIISCVFFMTFLGLEAVCGIGAAEYESVHDAGDIPPDSQFEHIFMVSNNTDLPVSAEYAETSCECLQIISFPDEIPVKGSHPLTVKLLPQKPGDFAYETVLIFKNGTRKKYLLTGTITASRIMTVRRDFLVSMKDKDIDTEGVLFVDIRASEKFNKLKIPGSVNMPLCMVKTKSFLKHKKLILTGSGFEYGVFADELEKIKNAGFDAKLLEGGMLAWYLSGRELLGDLSAVNQLDLIASEQYFPEKDYDSWIKADISENKITSPCHLITNAGHIPETMDKEEIKSKIINLKSCNILLFNKNGNYAEIRKKMYPVPGKNIFFLSGGLDAYEKFLNERHSVLNSRILAQRTKPCRGCP